MPKACIELSGVSDCFLTSKQTRSRYGDSSDMWLWRLLNDEKSGFPKPLMIRGRRFWRLSDLVAWESTMRNGEAA
jgi:predicted DNA-binding transcriptional regulator AlpA